MVKSERYTCNICNKQYSSASSIWNHRTKIHKNEHIDQGKYKVNINDDSGKQLVNINNIHSLEFNCRKCNKSYKQLMIDIENILRYSLYAPPDRQYDVIFCRCTHLLTSLI